MPVAAFAAALSWSFAAQAISGPLGAVAACVAIGCAGLGVAGLARRR